jgi:hypothetical protein
MQWAVHCAVGGNWQWAVYSGQWTVDSGHWAVERRQWKVYTDMDMDMVLHIGKKEGDEAIRVSGPVLAPVKIPLTLPLSRPSLHTLILWLVVVFE